MTTFAKLNYNALNYNSFRPHYPSSFYKILSDYLHKETVGKTTVEKSIDLGCATGITTYPLLSLSENVTGLDLSTKMIEGANSLLSQRCTDLGIEDHNRIRFEQGSTNEFLVSHEGSSGTVDLITAAQCIHWFGDFNLFFTSAAKLLKPKGTLAYWYYIDPIVVDYSGSAGDPLKMEKLQKAKSLYMKYVYEDPAFLGPHWEQPGRDILKHRLKKVNEQIPESIYKDVTIKSYEPSYDTFVPPSEHDLDLQKNSILLGDFINYLKTYSSYHKYKTETGDPNDVCNLFLAELEKELGWERNSTKIDLVWNTGYTFLTKK